MTLYIIELRIQGKNKKEAMEQFKKLYPDAFGILNHSPNSKHLRVLK